jgi:hemerythrin
LVSVYANPKQDFKQGGIMISEVREIEWSIDFETEVGAVDEQHRKYFNLLNDYLKKSAEHASSSEQNFDLLEKFKFLFEYAEEHFAAEEVIMTEVGYPDHESHRAEHLYFLKHVDELYKQVKAEGFSPSIRIELNYYIIEWFVEHIRLTDKKLAQFLKEQPV